MKNLVKNIKAKTSALVEKTKNFVKPALVAVAAALTTMPGYAADITIGDLENLSADALVGKIVGIVLTLARYVGIILLVTGIYQLIMAYKDDNADAKTRGITLAIVGIVLITLKALLKTFGIITF